FIFFFSSRRRHTRFSRDWSSDVCSSDLYLTDEEFAQRNEAVEQLARRYENEDSEGTMGMGHWAEVSAANRRTSWITSPANGRLPEFTPEGKRLPAELRPAWPPGPPVDPWLR